MILNFNKTLFNVFTIYLSYENFCQGFDNPKKYIATQGPKPNTVEDFWEMIWSQDSSVIVMLCNCKEKGKVMR